MDEADKEYRKIKDKAQGLFNYKDFWFDSWVVQAGRSLSPVHDNSFEYYIAHFREEAQASMMEGDTEQAQNGTPQLLPLKNILLPLPLGKGLQRNWLT